MQNKLDRAAVLTFLFSLGFSVPYPEPTNHATT